MLRILFSIAFGLSLAIAASAQWGIPPTGCSIRYDYDAAGDRISRYWYCWDINGGGEPGMVPAAESGAVTMPMKMSEEGDSSLSVLSLKAYPNPTKDHFILQLSGSIDQAEVVVYDAVGQQVLRTQMAGNRKELDIAAFARGLYHVCLIRQQEMFAVDLIKE